MKYRSRGGGGRRKIHYAQRQANVPGLKFGVYATATVLRLSSSSSNDHPFLHKLSLFALLLFFHVSAATPMLSYCYGRRFSAGVTTLSAALVVASLLHIAMEAEFGWLPYISRIFLSFLFFLYSMSRNGGGPALWTWGGGSLHLFYVDELS